MHLMTKFVYLNFSFAFLLLSIKEKFYTHTHVRACVRYIETIVIDKVLSKINYNIVSNSDRVSHFPTSFDALAFILQLSLDYPTIPTIISINNRSTKYS